MQRPDPLSTATRSQNQPLSSNGGLKVGLLSNRYSGRNRRSLDRIESFIDTQAHVRHHLVHRPQDIDAALDDLARQPLDVLAVNGGDGTVAATLTSLLERRPFPSLPALALLPGGTTNMTAADCGLRGNLLRAVRRLCSWADSGDPACTRLTRPVLRVQGGSVAAPRYGMFFGAGTIIQGIEYCHANLHAIGLGNELGPGLTMLRTIWGIARRDPRFATPVTITTAVDAHPLEETEQVTILLISSLERLFLGMHPYWGDGGGPFHYTRVREHARHLLRTFPSLLRGRPNHHATVANGYSSEDATEIRLSMDGSFTLDGEIYQATRDHPLVISDGGPVEFIRC